MTNLVTGATGLLGAHIMLELLDLNKPVRALYRSPESQWWVKSLFSFYGKASAYDRIEWHRGDLLDVDSLANALQDVGCVYHCAAIVSYHRADRENMYKINVEGTANVVNVALQSSVAKLVHISSIAALRRKDENSTIDEFGEWTDDNNNTHYGITKHLAEMEVHRGIVEGLDAVLINPGLIVGPGDFSRSSSSLFPKLDEGFSFYPPGGTGVVGVHDVAHAAVLLSEKGKTGERYIAVAENMSMKELFSLISTSLDKPIPQREAKQWMLEIARIMEWLKQLVLGKKALVTKESVKNASKRFIYSSEKIKNEIGMHFSGVEQSVREGAAFYKSLRSKTQ